MTVEKRHLGKTDIEITPIGLGCWQFGKVSGPLNFYKTPPQDEIDKIVKIALDGGINWFDTAEAYGKGDSERKLSKALNRAGRTADTIIATKWFPMSFFPGANFPVMPRTANNIAKNIASRQECLAPCKIDLLQIHRPWSLSSIEAQMKVMAALVKAGKIGSVGISQFSAAQMRRAYNELGKQRLPLASNQVRFNLLHRVPEKNGVLETARELNITLIAWSPLESGLLTGKFHDNPELVKKMPFMRKRMFARSLDKSRPVIKALQDIAKSYGCSASEVALSWLVNFYGNTVVAIPGATKTEQVKQNVGALNLKLTRSEMAKLDEISRQANSNT
jgi:aryl-alcohol dehydrogenase-like predicted oxidoreductase